MWVLQVATPVPVPAPAKKGLGGAAIAGIVTGASAGIALIAGTSFLARLTDQGLGPDPCSEALTPPLPCFH